MYNIGFLNAVYMDFVPSKNGIFPPAYVTKIQNGAEMMKKSEKMVNSKVTDMF